MLQNYFKVALRNILKYKFFSAINILGMTIGITACLLIILYIADEISYDKFHSRAERIYQVGLHGKISGQDIRTASTCPPMASTLVAEIPEVEAATRISPYWGKPSVKYNGKAFTEEKVIFADSNFFQFFSFKLLDGDIATALKEPNTVVVTEATAKKYFGNEQAMGKLLVIGNDNRSYKVTGIAANTPGNSHFSFNMLISASSNEGLKSTVWLNNYLYSYFLLRENAHVEQVNEKFKFLVEKYVGPEAERFMGISLKQMRSQGGEYGYYSTKLTDIHLHSTSKDDIEAGGNVMYIYFFAAIGLFIIVIACINFMNLSTARSAGRAKEVGLRKTLGSLRGQMVGQFLAESTVYSFAAVIFALVACYFLLPHFNLLSGKQLGMATLVSPLFISGLVTLVIIVGLVAGSYPAFYLTSFNAVEVLKGKVRAGMKSKGVRSFLVVFQFALSIFLIIFTLVVYQQIQYMQEKNMGIDKSNVLILQNTGRLGVNKEAFRNALAQQSGVTKLSYTNNTFPGVNSTTVFKEAGSEQDHIMGIYYADYDHMDVMKFEMKEGRYFSKEFPSDSMGIILNEAAAKEFGYQNPVGEEILYKDNGTTERLKVVGVVKNFNFESFKSQVRPLSIRLRKNENNLLIRYEGSAQSLISTIERLWRDNSSNEPFEYTFLDQEFDQLFRVEQRMGTIFSIFSALAIFIASLGLFALAAFTSEQRTKEIGIRKAMGATVFSLTVLLSREFTKLVLIAFVPAALTGWFISNHWLSGFVYRIEVSPWIIVLSGVTAVLIAWITVCYQSIKAAIANPVHSLRYE
ncbi:ABC transporter permease [Chryseosolibacter indicus]|uniref:ABC transporter permease n=1 Tax=Chryseosolibacter indicus TaxID=2782351 RepID=A0ABS5VRG5_9BACT|nr:ABC transporter permease [Chryseosolibacter indicus]MBT1704013.1 ABC transporter permease [Chryseosolibacter indicus]